MAAQSISRSHLVWRDLPDDYIGASTFPAVAINFWLSLCLRDANLQQSAMGIDGRWNRAKTPFRTGQFGRGMSRFDSVSSGHLISASAALPLILPHPGHTAQGQWFHFNDSIDRISKNVLCIGRRGLDQTLIRKLPDCTAAPRWSLEWSSKSGTDPTRAPLRTPEPCRNLLHVSPQCRSCQSQTLRAHPTPRARLMDPSQRDRLQAAETLVCLCTGKTDRQTFRKVPTIQLECCLQS